MAEIEPDVILRLTASSREFERAMRKVASAMVRTTYSFSIFVAKSQPQPRRHGAVKHARDMRRHYMKQVARG